MTYTKEQREADEAAMRRIRDAATNLHGFAGIGAPDTRALLRLIERLERDLAEAKQRISDLEAGRANDDRDYRELHGQLAESKQEADGWKESARHFSEGSDYYRGLIDRIGALFGAAAFTADDGSVSDSVLRAKVPELVEALRAERDRLREFLIGLPRMLMGSVLARHEVAERVEAFIAALTPPAPDSGYIMSGSTGGARAPADAADERPPVGSSWTHPNTGELTVEEYDAEGRWRWSSGVWTYGPVTMAELIAAGWRRIDAPATAQRRPVCDCKGCAFDREHKAPASEAAGGDDAADVIARVIDEGLPPPPSQPRMSDAEVARVLREVADALAEVYGGRDVAAVRKLRARADELAGRDDSRKDKP